jgi:hypothetical protein
VLTLIIVTILASIAFRRIAGTKGYPANRIQFYPAAILASVLVPALCAELFLTFATSHGFCSEAARTALLFGINILCFIFYFGALSRSTIRLKNLPPLPSAPRHPNAPNA